MFRLVSVATLTLAVVHAKGGHHKHHQEGGTPPDEHVEQPHKSAENPAPPAAVTDHKTVDTPDKKTTDKKKDQVERGRSLLQKLRTNRLKTDDDWMDLFDALATIILASFLVAVSVCFAFRNQFRKPLVDHNSTFMMSFVEQSTQCNSEFMADDDQLALQKKFSKQKYSQFDQESNSKQPASKKKEVEMS